MPKVAQLHCESQTQLCLSARPIPCGLHEQEYQRRHQSEAPTACRTPGKKNPSILLLLTLLWHLLCWCTRGGLGRPDQVRWGLFSKVTARVLSHWIRVEILYLRQFWAMGQRLIWGATLAIPSPVKGEGEPDFSPSSQETWITRWKTRLTRPPYCTGLPSNHKWQAANSVIQSQWGDQS